MTAVILSVGQKILQLGYVGNLVRKGIETSISVLVKTASITEKLQAENFLQYINKWGLQLSALREI